MSALNNAYGELLNLAKTEEKIWYDYGREVMPRLAGLRKGVSPEKWKTSDIPPELMQRIGTLWIPFSVALKFQKRIKKANQALSEFNDEMDIVEMGKLLRKLKTILKETP